MGWRARSGQANDHGSKFQKLSQAGQPGNPGSRRRQPVPGERRAGMIVFERVPHSSHFKKPTSLYGRRGECRLLDGLLEGARGGRSAALVIWGEAGVGKSALLDYAVDSAADLRVERVAGVEAEAELAYAALHQLCRPLLDLLGQLPGTQRAALRTAFGLEAGPPPDRFLVGLAVLGLLTAAAAEGPLMCVVDDTQWLDRASAQALAFAARRLTGPALLVFAARDPGTELAGLPELAVRGLRDTDARELLASVVRWPLDEQVTDQIVAETRGNPMALLELPQGLPLAQLAGGFGLPGTPLHAGRPERNLLRQLEPLPVTTRLLLLAAAAEPIGEVVLLWRAAERLGIAADAAAPAEEAGLIEVGTRVRFCHPLLRAAVYRAAPLSDRRKVHQALAEATDPAADPDRRAWHRARAAAGPDDTVADELERSAARAQARGGMAATAAFLQRSAELTPDPARRGARALAAARAKVAVGAADAAHQLLMMAELGGLDELQRAELARLRAKMAFAERRGEEAPPLLLDAAKQLGALDSCLARETYLEALVAAIITGRLGAGLTVREVAETTRTAPPALQPPRPIDLLLDGTVTRLTEGYVAGVPPLRRALNAARRDGGTGEADIMGWLIAPELWDDATWHELTVRAVRSAREAGALAVLPVALSYRAAVHMHAGELSAAAGRISEANAIAAATGSASLGYMSLMLAAWRGEETRVQKLIGTAVQDAAVRGEGRALGLAGYATALLCNGLGSYEAALAGARRACEYEDLGFFGWSVAELVEAGARVGASDEASAALRQLAGRASAAGTDWALGVQARCRALLADGRTAGPLYLEAIERLGRTRVRTELARAHLVYGEWLRREQRRLEAREHLRAAHDMFGRFGAGAFADRARRELQAAGETVRKAAPDVRQDLTVREAQVAQLAAEGHTNSEIGARLFISPRTAEYHLHKVFSKLGITSRRHLGTALRNPHPAQPESTAGSRRPRPRTHAGDFDGCELPSAGETLYGDPS
jgi:DNA-binding CsgD family transcriptional regulator